MSLEPDLLRLLKRLELGQVVPTLPDRLALARAQKLNLPLAGVRLPFPLGSTARNRATDHPSHK